MIKAKLIMKMSIEKKLQRNRLNKLNLYKAINIEAVSNNIDANSKKVELN